MEAKSIRVSGGSTETDGDGGSCNYEVSTLHAVVFVAFFPFVAGATTDDIAKSITGNPDFAGKISDVSGLGDSAKFIVNPIPGLNVTQYHLMVTFGTALMDVVNPATNGVKDDDKAREQLEQVARTVLSRL
jgi:hypothetical protein